MDLVVYRHLWGLEPDADLGFTTWLPSIAAAGYRGVEGMPPPPSQAHAFRAALDDVGLEFVAQVVTCFPARGGSPAEHIASFRAQVERATTLRPVFINAHSGVDLWSIGEAHSYLREVRRIERDLGVLVTHETHRGRLFWNPRDTLALLSEHEGLSLCADLSHWVTVCERMLEDQEHAIVAIAPRVRHVHARVGHEQGPQVNDPRAPEWARHVATFERWWDTFWDAQAAAGLARTTLTPEFGPPPYQPTAPGSRTPLADPWQVSLWMAERQRRRFAGRRSTTLEAAATGAS